MRWWANCWHYLNPSRTKESEAELNKKIADKDVIIKGDVVEIETDYQYLIENAIKFTDTGSIEIEYSRAGDRLVIAVKDTGIGIEEQEKQLISEKFRQIEITTARKYGGIGLGLFHFKRIYPHDVRSDQSGIRAGARQYFLCWNTYIRQIRILITISRFWNPWLSPAWLEG